MVAPKSATAQLMLGKSNPSVGTKVCTIIALQLAWEKKEGRIYAPNTRLIVRKIVLNDSKLRETVRYQSTSATGITNQTHGMFVSNSKPLPTAARSAAISAILPMTSKSEAANATGRPYGSRKSCGNPL